VEGEVISRAIRQELQARKRIAAHGRSVLQLTPLHLTEAERGDRAFYQGGDVIVFQRSAREHRKGERIIVGSDLPDELLSLAASFGVYRPGELELAEGDLVRITANGKTIDEKHRLNNGSLYQVAGFDKRVTFALRMAGPSPPTTGF
jgi:hypothetical protein